MKTKILLIVCLLLNYYSVVAQNHTQLITAYQYFFDSDPGHGIAGNGAVVQISIPLADFEEQLNISIPAGLSSGLHRFCFRVMDEYGKWSTTTSSIFYVVSIDQTQNVAAYQYYFDSDPGQGIAGNGAVVQVSSPSSDFEQQLSISIPSDLTTGMHTFHFRVMDENGRWSSKMASVFYILSTEQTQSITAYQYFFDTDPGVGNAGNGSIVAIASTDNLDQGIPISIPSSLETGIHTLYFRTKDEFGRWSTKGQSIFYVDRNASDNNIVVGEYFFDTDPGLGNGIPISLSQSSTSVDLNLHIPVPNSLTQCKHILRARFKNAENRWSLVETLNFNNPHKHARVLFEPVVYANKVYFETDTLNVNSINWNFGDGGTSSFLKPIHEYNQAGNYNVRLIGSNAQCPNDTMIQPVTIAGVRHLECKRGCNNGLLTLNINGGALTASTIVKLKKSGFPDITPVSQTFINNTLIRARFNLNNSSVGMRDLELTIPGMGTYTLTDEFEVVSACNDSLQIVFEGSSRFRSGGGFTTFLIPSGTRVQNKSAQDAVAVPIIWRDRNSITGESIDGLSTLIGIPVFDATFQYLSSNGINPDIMNFHLADDSSASRLGGVIIPRIFANSSSLIPLNIYSSTLAVDARVSAVLNPLLKSDADGSNVTINNNFTFRHYMKHGIEKVLSIQVDTNLFYPCYNNAYNLILSALANDLSNGLNISFPAVLSAILANVSTSGCVSNLPASLSDFDFRKIIVETMGTLAYGERSASGVNTPNLNSPTTQQLSRARGGFGDDGVCDMYRRDFPQNFGDTYDIGFGVIHAIRESVQSSDGSAGKVRMMCAAGSSDPNHKYGPADSPNKIWTSERNDKVYQIDFENLSNASAPAITVTVTDTLDLTKINALSFRWGNILVGTKLLVDLSEIVDSTIIKIVDLPFPMTDKLLIIGDYKPSTGIVKWKLTTVDPVNFQEVSGAFDGFLPPNTDGEGAGTLTYRVDYKQEVQTGDTITNKATIVFDENDPITTNLYLNRFDEIIPQSSVAPLPPSTENDTFQVNVSGSDIISGVAYYSLYVSVNDGAYNLYNEVSGSGIEFIGQQGNKYEFFSIAVDEAGNFEDSPADPHNQPDAVTIVECRDTFYADTDGDLFGNPANYIVECSKPDGYVLNDKDCNDQSSIQNPDAPELCDNNVDDNCDGVIDEGCNITLHARLFLQGFYIGNGKLYAVADAQVYPDLCDTVIVELHDPTSLIVSYTSNATIDIDGNLQTQFPFEARDHSYYLGIRHRNCIETWSSNPVSMLSHTYYDFTTASSNAYGDNQLESFDQNGWMFYTGDLNQDGSIDGSDFLELDPSIQNGDGGYTVGDLNGDGAVDGSDFLILDPNIQLGVGAAIP